MVMQSQAPLFLVIGALHSPCGFPSSLNGRKEQADEKSDDRNDDEKFDKRERLAVVK